MDLEKKKIIAREFLLFLVCIIIALLTYIGIHSYNFIKEKKITKLNYQLKIKQVELDSLKKTINPQTAGKYGFSGFDEAVKEFDAQILPPPPQKKQSSLRSDQIPIYEFLLNNGLTSKDKASFYQEYKDVNKQKSLYKFLIENNLTTKSFNQFSVDNFQNSGSIDDLPSLKDLGLEKSVTTLHQKINSLQKRVNTIWFIKKEESKTILTSRQINLATLNIFLICLASVFGLRYLWSAINWSIKTIKS